MKFKKEMSMSAEPLSTPNKIYSLCLRCTSANTWIEVTETLSITDRVHCKTNTHYFESFLKESTKE